MIEIVALADRPALVTAIAPWIWQEWGRARPETLEEVTAGMAAKTARLGPEQCFVLLEDGQPVATASLFHQDLDARPDLTPWLGAVFVHPDHRGRGHARRLVRRVEAACIEAAIATLWLHTEFARGMYEGLGWTAVEPQNDRGHAVTLMRRDFRGQAVDEKEGLLF